MIRGFVGEMLLGECGCWLMLHVRTAVCKLLDPPLLCVACGGLGLLSWLHHLELLVRPVLRASLSLSWLEAWWPGGFSVFFFLRQLLVLARVGVRGPVNYAPSAFIGRAPQQAEQR